MTDLSPVITRWWECDPAVNDPMLQGAVDESIRTTLSTDARVLVLYGNRVQKCFELVRLRRSLPGTERTTIECIGGVVKFCMITPSNHTPFWVVPVSSSLCSFPQNGCALATIALADERIEVPFPTRKEEAVSAAAVAA